MLYHYELSRYPMENIILLRILKYWLKLIKTDTCILKCLYEELLKADNEIM